MPWIRDERGDLYNLDYVVSLAVEPGPSTGSSQDVLVARLADGRTIELAASPYGIDMDKLADLVRRSGLVIDVIADDVAESAESDETVGHDDEAA